MAYRRVLLTVLVLLHALCGCAANHGQGVQACPPLMPPPPVVPTSLESSLCLPNVLVLLAGLGLGCLSALGACKLLGLRRCARLARGLGRPGPDLARRLRWLLRDMEGILAAGQRQAKVVSLPVRVPRRRL
jgi:hypothetical protein